MTLNKTNLHFIIENLLLLYLQNYTVLIFFFFKFLSYSKITSGKFQKEIKSKQNSNASIDQYGKVFNPKFLKAIKNHRLESVGEKKFAYV